MNKFLTILKYFCYVCVIFVMNYDYGTGIAGLTFMVFTIYELNNFEWKNQHKHNSEVLGLTQDAFKVHTERQTEFDVALKEVERDVDLIKERLK